MSVIASECLTRVVCLVLLEPNTLYYEKGGLRAALFLFIVSMFLIFLIFLAFEVSHAHAFMRAFESIHQEEFGKLYTSNKMLDFRLNRLQQEYFELKMSHNALMNVLEQINLIDESTISLIEEKSLSFKEVKIFQKENF